MGTGAASVGPAAATYGGIVPAPAPVYNAPAVAPEQVHVSGDTGAAVVGPAAATYGGFPAPAPVVYVAPAAAPGQVHVSGASGATVVGPAAAAYGGIAPVPVYAAPTASNQVHVSGPAGAATVSAAAPGYAALPSHHYSWLYAHPHYPAAYYALHGHQLPGYPVAASGYAAAPAAPGYGPVVKAAATGFLYQNAQPYGPLGTV